MHISILNDFKTKAFFTQCFFSVELAFILLFGAFMYNSTHNQKSKNLYIFLGFDLKLLLTNYQQAKKLFGF